MANEALAAFRFRTFSDENEVRKQVQELLKLQKAADRNLHKGIWLEPLGNSYIARYLTLPKRNDVPHPVSASDCPDDWGDKTMDEYNSVSDNVEVRSSPLQGNGVFVKDNCAVVDYTWISPYHGEEVCAIDGSDFKYGLTIGDIVFDAQRLGHESSCGHIVNSCHPSLPPPYNKPMRSISP